MTWLTRLFRRRGKAVTPAALHEMSREQLVLEYERLRASIAEYRLGHQETCLELARAQLDRDALALENERLKAELSLHTLP